MPEPWECPDCHARYGVRLVAGCPRCRALPPSTPTEDEQMPKITVVGGPSNFTADWSDDADAPEVPAEGSESSPGSNSSASSPTSAGRTSSSGPCAPGPAPTTEPLSNREPTESFTAAPTDGSTPATGDQDRPLAEDYDARTVVELRVLLKDRGLSTAGSKADMVQRLTDADAFGADDTQESSA